MKQFFLLWAFLLPFHLYPQLNESFSGMDVTSSNPWEGDIDKFRINASGQLQFTSPAGKAGSASIRFPLPSFEETMTWEMDVKLDFKSTDDNNLRIYVYASDTIYIQAGNNARRVSLYEKDIKNNTKPRITGRKALLDEPYAFVSIRLTLEKGRIWTLYTRKEGERDFYKEGVYKMSSPSGNPQALMIITCRYIKGRISEYFIDNLNVTHEISEMPEPAPDEYANLKLLSVTFLHKNDIQFVFDKPVNIANAFCYIENAGEAILSYGANQATVNVRPPKPMESGGKYLVVMEGLCDLEGNRISKQAWEIQYENEEEKKPEEPLHTVEPGDIVFNELLPEPFTGGSEYVELYNRTSQPLSLAGLSLAVIKPDGMFSTSYPLDGVSSAIDGGGYALLTKDKDAVAAFYLLSSPEAVHELKLPVLANESSNLVLFRTHDRIVIDDVSYSSQWHDASIKNRKGVALERINPDGETQHASNWMSAASTAGYGTPGYRNSRFAYDGDGDITGISSPRLREDGFYSIAYYMGSHGYRCRIYIYDMAGSRVAEVANHAFPGLSGEFIWDGKSSAGERLRTGVYILHAELYNTNGQKKHEQVVFLVK
jgi:hypothetical protein